MSLVEQAGEIALISDTVTEHPLAGRKVTVVGAGIVGLTTALHLQSIGAEVRIVSPIVPGGKGWGSMENPAPMASEVSGASWKPYHLDFPNAGLAQEILNASWDWYQELIADGFPGVYMMRHFETSNKPINVDAKKFYLDIIDRDHEEGNLRLPDYYALHPNEIPGGYQYALSYKTVHINPTEFLPALIERFKNNKANPGSVVELDGKYTSLDQVLSQEGDAIFICTGLGTRDFMEGTGLEPEAGEIVQYSPIVWNKGQEPYSISAADDSVDDFDGRANQYGYPQNTHFTAGGTGYKGELLDVRKIAEEHARRGAERNFSIAGTLNTGQGIRRVGYRPSRPGGVLMESKQYVRADGSTIMVTLNVGHGGAGMTTAPGTALVAVKRLEEKMVA